MKYYRLTNIMKKAPKAQYYMVFGERSNGKTYSVIELGLKNFLSTGKQFAIVRRWKEDIVGKNGASMLNNLVLNEKGVNTVKKLTKGKYDNIVYRSRRWYLAYYDSDLDRMVLNEKPIAYAFAITDYEHDKSSSYPEITTILFDEFMTKGNYLPDEFIFFQQVISTIVRGRDNVTVFMCANTVSMYNPYFSEMGLIHARQMKPGDIEIYKYGDSKLEVAVEYSDSPNKAGKPSDVYFAFNNPKLKMITNGLWQIDIYPHIQANFEKKHILFTYFVVFEEYILQCEIVSKDNLLFTYVHVKTTPIKDNTKDIIYQLQPVEERNYYTNLLYPCDDLSKKITYFYKANKVFYQSNDIGEVMNNYLNQCKKSIMK